MPAYLTIEPWKSEPDTRSGEKPEALQGTLRATGLAAGSAYDVYRWDSPADALTYSASFKKTTFTATADTYNYTDDTSFQSSGTTYYRVVAAA